MADDPLSIVGREVTSEALADLLRARNEPVKTLELARSLGREDEVRRIVLRSWGVVAIATCRTLPRHARRDALLERFGPTQTLTTLRDALGMDFARRCMAGLLDLPLTDSDAALDLKIALALPGDARGSLWSMVEDAQHALPEAWLTVLREHGFAPSAAVLACRELAQSDEELARSLRRAGYGLTDVLRGFTHNGIGPDRSLAALRAVAIPDDAIGEAAREAGRLDPEIREILKMLERGASAPTDQ